MCLTQPGTVVDVRPNELVVEVEGRIQIVSSLLVPEARVGDHVLIGLGRALNVLTPAEAADLREALALITAINLESA